jgi:hypothetical protein
VPLPLLFVKPLIAATTIATSEASKLAVASVEKAFGHDAQAAAAAAKAAAAAVKSDAEPSIEHAALVYLHRHDPKWFLRRMVKVRFEEPGGVEYLWLRVLKAGRGMVGQLFSQPDIVEGHPGDVLVFRQRQIVDVQVTLAKKAKAKRRKSRGR